METESGRECMGRTERERRGTEERNVTRKEGQVAAGSSHSPRKGGQHSEDGEWESGGLGEGKGAMGAEHHSVILYPFWLGAECLPLICPVMGLVAQLGNTTVKSGSTLQTLTALSVGESDFYAVLKRGQAGLSLRSVSQDPGIQ